MPPTPKQRPTKEQIKGCFHLRLCEAADALGICQTLLKKFCREYGIDRWPFRKIHSLKRRGDKIKETLANLTGDTLYQAVATSEKESKSPQKSVNQKPKKMKKKKNSARLSYVSFDKQDFDSDDSEEENGSDEDSFDDAENEDDVSNNKENTELQLKNSNQKRIDNQSSYSTPSLTPENSPTPSTLPVNSNMNIKQDNNTTTQNNIIEKFATRKKKVIEFGSSTKVIDHYADCEYTPQVDESFSPDAISPIPCKLSLPSTIQQNQQHPNQNMMRQNTYQPSQNNYINNLNKQQYNSNNNYIISNLTLPPASTYPINQASGSILQNITANTSNNFSQRSPISIVSNVIQFNSTTQPNILYQNNNHQPMTQKPHPNVSVSSLLQVDSNNLPSIRDLFSDFMQMPQIQQRSTTIKQNTLNF